MVKEVYSKLPSLSIYMDVHTQLPIDPLHMVTRTGWIVGLRDELTSASIRLEWHCQRHSTLLSIKLH